MQFVYLFVNTPASIFEKYKILLVYILPLLNSPFLVFNYNDLLGKNENIVKYDPV